MKSGNLNFLEPSGPLQACNGTALPLYQALPTQQQPKFKRYPVCGMFVFYTQEISASMHTPFVITQQNVTESQTNLTHMWRQVQWESHYHSIVWAPAVMQI